MELRAKEVIDELAAPGIILLIYRLVLKDEI